MLCETVIKTLFMGRRVGGDAKAVGLSGFRASLKQVGLCEVGVFEVSEMH